LGFPNIQYRGYSFEDSRRQEEEESSIGHPEHDEMMCPCFADLASNGREDKARISPKVAAPEGDDAFS